MDPVDCVIVRELLDLRALNRGSLWKSLMRAHPGDYERLHDKLRDVARERILIGGGRGSV